MKTRYIILCTLMLASCKSSNIPEQTQKTVLEVNKSATGQTIIFDFKKGKEHNHPSFVLWAEDMEGNFIQTLFITSAVGTSVYEHGDPSTGKWMPGVIRRPAALPYWAHKRGIKESDGLYMPSPKNPIADAYTGATPPGDLTLTCRFDKPTPRKFMILFEINQTWDWNEYWTNNKYPEDDEYKTSCQPALVYATEINLDQPQESYELKVIGHSHYSGMTGELFPDLSTITTALEIAGDLTVKLVQ